MNPYIRTQVVLARPMTRQAYNDYRGWQLPANENGADEGYLVECQDGSKPNMVSLKGSFFWYPKEQFDKLYTELLSHRNLPLHQQSVVKEREDLDDKLDKLWAFFQTRPFADLLQAEKYHMEKQYEYMGLYSDMLQARIAKF